MDELIDKYRELLARVPMTFIRGLASRINWDARAICIEGARGTGKSTLMLQHIRKELPPDESLYISLDDLYFRKHSFYELADTFYKRGGRYLYADEIHKYDNWQQELKNIYDFFPDLKLVVSGSSILALQESRADLSRRLLRYKLPELSLREFIALETGEELPVFELESLLSKGNKIIDEIRERIPSPLKHYRDYLKMGAYPFFIEGKEEFLYRVNELIKVIIDYDLPEGRDITSATRGKLKTLLYVISTIVPFTPNIAKLARQVKTSRTRLLGMLDLLEQAQLISNLRAAVHGTSLLNKPEKVYLHNTSLIYALSEGRADIGNLRETFMLTQMRNAGHTVTYPETGDFRVDNKYLFEVGGKNKGRKQLSGEKNAFIAADDIVYGTSGKTPLWLFGLMY